MVMIRLRAKELGVACRVYSILRNWRRLPRPDVGVGAKSAKTWQGQGDGTRRQGHRQSRRELYQEGIEVSGRCLSPEPEANAGGEFPGEQHVVG